MEAVGKAAFQMVEEVRRQFREIKGIMEGKARPDYARCVDINSKRSQADDCADASGSSGTSVYRLYSGKEALAGLLAGVSLSGVLMAIFLLTRAGPGIMPRSTSKPETFGGKGTPTHAAAVVGDTVGDPCKDTAGPSLNILIKLMSIVSLVFASAVQVSSVCRLAVY